MKFRPLTSITVLAIAAAATIAATPHGVPESSCRYLPGQAPSETAPLGRGVCTVVTTLKCSPGTAAGKVHAAAVHQEPRFDTNPLVSFTTGAGCGGSDSDAGLLYGTTQATPYDFTFAGSIDGNLDTLTIEMHVANAGTERVEATRHQVELRVSIDGKSPFGTETVTGATGQQFETPRIVEVPITLVPSATGATSSFKISIRGLADKVGLAPAAGYGGGEEREVLVTLGNIVNADMLALPTGSYTYLWGASEIASGITFNPPALTGSLLSATG